MNTISLGNFLVSTGKVTITDPAYVPKTWCQVNTKVATGNWTAQIIEKHNEIHDLIAFLGNQAPAQESKEWKLVNSTLGVDSGMIGIYETEEYFAAWDDEKVQAVAVNKLHSELVPNPFGGTLEKGVVCIPNRNDSFNLYVIKDAAGEIIALKVKFVY